MCDGLLMNCEDFTISHPSVNQLHPSNMPPKRKINPAYRTALIDQFSVYMVTMSVMCDKAQHIPNIMGVHKALEMKSASRKEFDASIDLNRDWKSFLAKIDEIYKEDPDDPER
ncbi:hypothetical protein FRB94_007168 [Tulasnella sp. JGI-2019a]|nr:hypothetical protein FRB94_007168 [Tulasnella sp. JGI-2019a]KAG9006529.1 hypothetical protein FRB93_008657 [Tulasnella sp. JGI-2019a]KAG9023803.1 hypothetical protein FRB95_012474 [Tulasnella sp. JGI-2019a]